MAPVDENLFKLGKAGWTKSGSGKLIDKLYDIVTKKFGRDTFMTDAQLADLQQRFLTPLGLTALSTDELASLRARMHVLFICIKVCPCQIAASINLCVCHSHQLKDLPVGEDGRRDAIFHVGCCAHGHETQRHTSCPAGKFCTAVTACVQQVAGKQVGNVFLNHNPTCLREDQHCVTDIHRSLGDELDTARMKLLVVAKLILEANMKLKEVACMVAGTATMVMTVKKYEYSGIQGIAAEWLPALAGSFATRPWSAPYYNSCIGCTVGALLPTLS
ncbi:hypothetical protein MMC07_000394 [Pseudocyphellaria aurata]|nr:hypothetical protein [Pseudocyphellaria aurata]